MIHYNLKKTFGFIVPSGTFKVDSKKNVYFGLKAYIGRKEVVDLTQELNINEKVGFVALNHVNSITVCNGTYRRFARVTQKNKPRTICATVHFFHHIR